MDVFFTHFRKAGWVEICLAFPFFCKPPTPQQIFYYGEGIIDTGIRINNVKKQGGVVSKMCEIHLIFKSSLNVEESADYGELGFLDESMK